MAMAKPWPSAPTRFAMGTRQSSKLTIRVGCEFQPTWTRARRDGWPSETPFARPRRSVLAPGEDDRYVSRWMIPFSPFCQTTGPQCPFPPAGTRSLWDLQRAYAVRGRPPIVRIGGARSVSVRPDDAAGRGWTTRAAPGPPVRHMTRYTSLRPPPLINAWEAHRWPWDRHAHALAAREIGARAGMPGGRTPMHPCTRGPHLGSVQDVVAALPSRRRQQRRRVAATARLG